MKNLRIKSLAGTIGPTGETFRCPVCNSVTSKKGYETHLRHHRRKKEITLEENIEYYGKIFPKQAELWRNRIK